MKELFNITPHSTGDGFTMDLKTGVVDVPDENGLYNLYFHGRRKDRVN